MSQGIRYAAVLAIMVVALTSARPVQAGDPDQLLTIDQYIDVRSTVPAIAGQTSRIHVREKVLAGALAPGAKRTDQVVLFVHGAGAAAEPAFDVPYQDYSWMAYLAKAGFDTFALDLTGYGRSTRPEPMNDPCNVDPKLLTTLLPGVASGKCEASHSNAMTTMGSDLNDISAVVSQVLSLRHAERLSLIGWSLGGPRAEMFAAQHPEKINRLVLLAPVYKRPTAQDPHPAWPEPKSAINIVSHDSFVAGWDRQVGCPGQYDQAVSDVVWASQLDTDPVGASWGSGVRRAPTVSGAGRPENIVARVVAPTLLLTGEHDKFVPSANVRDLLADLGSGQKLIVELTCTSHFAMWERNHLQLFRASLEWLSKGMVNGQDQGALRLGVNAADDFALASSWVEQFKLDGWYLGGP